MGFVTTRVDIEIKDKKWSDNVITDHLSRIESIVEGSRGIEIEESFPDEQLFHVKSSYLVC